MSVPRLHLVWGAALSMIGIGVMAFAAWSTHEDQHYDDFGWAMTTLAAMMGGALLLLGQGPFVPWLLGILGRRVVRLPPPLRMAARDVAGRRARTTPAVATTMVATALAITTMIIAAATTAQSRAEYHPQARPGALLVDGFWTEEAATVRAAVQHELPGIPIAQSERRLGEAAVAYVERGFQAPTGWLVLVAVMVSVALGGALAMTLQATGSRSRRVLLRAGGGSSATLRLFAACRAGLGAACGTAMGAVAGCVIGLLLVWPLTASIEWEPMPRVAFDTPWPSIAALVIGLPVLAAVAAGLAPPRMTVRSAPPGEPPGRQGTHAHRPGDRL